ncbi:hypothetical protein EH223_05375 [candidate division KSB1 bacterium]|nr:hypothetical protein [candidate division KSB1 bacterium]RQW05193.1 MAG: hypothetical protein EH223_05375 [candidate division KSB1 bacterium]
MRFYIFLGLILIVCMVCSKKPTEPEKIEDPESEPENKPFAIFFSPDSAVISPGDSINLSLEIANLQDSIFAMSFKLDYDAVDEYHILTIITYGSSDFDQGDFFGNEPLIFLEKGYVFLSLIQGQPLVSGSGTLGEFTFHARSPGLTLVSLSELCFYNASGDEISVETPDLSSSFITIEP